MRTLVPGGGDFDTDALESDLGILSRYSYLFTSDYLESAESAGRLYAVLYAIPSVFSTNPLLGLGPGSFLHISQSVPDEQVFDKADQLGLEVLPLRYLHDVGYAALYVQVGLMGTLAFVLIFVRIYRRVSVAEREQGDPFVQAFLTGALGFLVALAVQNLACYNVTYRSQSILVWTVCGLAALFVNRTATINTSAFVNPKQGTKA